MPQTSGQFSELLAPGLRKVFFDTYKDWSEEYSRIATVESSTRAYEDELIVAGLGRMERKAEGHSIAYDRGTQGGKQRFTHVTFGLGFRVSMELYQDDLYNVMKRMSKQLARSVRQTVELEFGAFIDDLFTGTTYTTVDDNPCCYSTGHPLTSGGTYANAPAVAIDLSVSGIRAASERMERCVDERGLPIMLMPSTLLVSPTYQWVAKEILGSEKVPYSADNTVNATQQILGLNYMVSHFMSDTDQWNMFADKSQHDIKFFWRMKPEFDNADDFDNKDAKFSAVCRFSMGFTDWRGVDGSAGAA